MGELGWPKYVGKLGWFNWVGVLGWLELAYPTACACLFKVRPGVLSETLSHLCGKLNLSIFLFYVGLFTLMNKDSLIYLAKPCPSLLFGSILHGRMACVITVMMYRRGFHKVLFESFSKGPRSFSYVFICNVTYQYKP